MKQYLESSAIISEDKKHRYQLSRCWNKNKKRCLFIMLNPSTADGTNDDKTINKCVNYANKLNCGSLKVVNLFSWRSRHKSEIRMNESIGRDNDFHIINCAQNSDLIICAWGNAGKYRNRGNEIKKLLKSEGYTLYCLKLSKKGEPCHPLYLKNEIKLQQI